MKIKNIGVDIEEIKRFKKLPYKSNESFYQRIFTDTEISYCLSKDNPYPHFAARFAGKEAVLKAVNQSIYKLKSIEIANSKNGAPQVKMKIRGKILISLSHTKNQALAFAIWLN